MCVDGISVNRWVDGCVMVCEWMDDGMWMDV